MSLFGPIDDSDRRRWQHQGLTALTQLIQLGHEKKLPPIAWTLPAGSRLVGRIDSFGDHPPRAVYDQWYAALSQRGEVEPWPERTSDAGRTTLTARFTVPLGGPPSTVCKVVLIAEWFAEDLVQAVEK